LELVLPVDVLAVDALAVDALAVDVLAVDVLAVDVLAVLVVERLAVHVLAVDSLAVVGGILCIMVPHKLLGLQSLAGAREQALTGQVVVGVVTWFVIIETNLFREHLQSKMRVMCMGKWDNHRTLIAYSLYG
jgi:hypothetical protein